MRWLEIGEAATSADDIVGVGGDFYAPWRSFAEIATDIEQLDRRQRGQVVLQTEFTPRAAMFVRNIGVPEGIIIAAAVSSNAEAEERLPYLLALHSVPVAAVVRDGHGPLTLDALASGVDATRSVGKDALPAEIAELYPDGRVALALVVLDGPSVERRKDATERLAGKVVVVTGNAAGSRGTTEEATRR